MLLKLNPNHRKYDCPLTEIAHIRSLVKTRLDEECERQREQREHQVMLILSTSRLAHQQWEQWLKTRIALRFVDRVFILFTAVIAGLWLWWALWH